MFLNLLSFSLSKGLFQEHPTPWALLYFFSWSTETTPTMDQIKEQKTKQAMVEAQIKQMNMKILKTKGEKKKRLGNIIIIINMVG
jgi:hypothetical protein